jgi:hypothetical protein
MTHDYDWKNFIPAPEVRRDFIGGRSAMTELTWRKQGTQRTSAARSANGASKDGSCRGFNQ